MARKCFYHPCFQWKPHLGAAYIKGRFLLEDGFYKEYATVGAASIIGRFCISGRTLLEEIRYAMDMKLTP